MLRYTTQHRAPPLLSVPCSIYCVCERKCFFYARHWIVQAFSTHIPYEAEALISVLTYSDFYTNVGSSPFTNWKGANWTRHQSRLFLMWKSIAVKWLTWCIHVMGKKDNQKLATKTETVWNEQNKTIKKRKKKKRKKERKKANRRKTNGNEQTCSNLLSFPIRHNSRGDAQYRKLGNQILLLIVFEHGEATDISHAHLGATFTRKRTEQLNFSSVVIVTDRMPLWNVAKRDDPSSDNWTSFHTFLFVAHDQHAVGVTHMLYPP